MRRRNRRIGEYSVNHRQKQRGNYKRKCQHKRKVKDLHAKLWNMPDWQTMVLTYISEPPKYWGHPLEYWRNFDKSTHRKYAKRRTSKLIRNEFRDHIRNMADFEDAGKAMHRNQYQAYFDYAWETN